MEFRLPELGEGVYEAELTGWFVKPGDAVKRGHNLLEVMTDKATMEVPSPFAGTVTGLLAEPGRQVKVGDPVLTYTVAGGEDEDTRRQGDKETERKEKKQVDGAVAAPTGTRIAATVEAVRAAPSVRYLARKLGVDLTQVAGSGPGGRILFEDLSPYLKAERGGEKRPAVEVRPDYGKPGTRIKLQGLRRKIAEHMVRAKRTIPHYSYVDECDVTELVRLREALRDSYAPAGIKLTYLAFVVKAVTAALKDVPLVNASLDEEAGEIVLHDHYHVGIAVATPGGLIVPVLHDADRMDLGQVARGIERLSTAARTGKVRPDELRGGTFTVTSVGGIGGLFSTPVINHPQVAILGLGKVVRRPVYDAAGNVRPADLVYLSLSFDHRVVDGAVGATFCNAVIRRLQNPAALLLPDKLG